MKQLTEQFIFEPHQIKILNGLKQFSPRMANLYEDGLQIINSSGLKSKVNLLGHILREIDSELSAVLLGESKFNGESAHKKKIAFVLGVEVEHPTVDKWHKISRKFEKYAHGSRVGKTIYNIADLYESWNEYEGLLSFFIANHFCRLDRIDKIIQQDVPNESTLGALDNLLKIESNSRYFFENLKKPKWLNILKSKGYFEPKLNPRIIYSLDEKGKSYTPYWNVLDYLFYLAKTISTHPDKNIETLLFEIVNQITNYKDESGQRIKNYYTDNTILKILGVLAGKNIITDHINFIKLLLDSKHSSLFISGIIDRDIFTNFLNKCDKTIFLNFMSSVLSFKIKEKDFADVKMIEVIPLVESHHLQSIIKNNFLKLSESYPRETINLLLKLIKDIVSSGDNRFNKRWVHSIQNPHHLSSNEYHASLIDLIRNLLLSIPVSSLKELLESMISSEITILRRISIYIIGTKYTETSNLFWNIKYNPIAKSETRKEVFDLLNENIKCINEGDTNILLNWLGDIYETNKAEFTQEQAANIVLRWLKIFNKSDKLSFVKEG